MNAASMHTTETDAGRQIRPGADWTVVDAGDGDVRYDTPARGPDATCGTSPQVRRMLPGVAVVR